MHESVPATSSCAGQRLARQRQILEALGRMTPREPEVEHLDALVWRDHHVGAFQIAMDDAVLMRVRQRARDLTPESQDLFDGRRTVGDDPIGETIALDELHRDERLPVERRRFREWCRCSDDSAARRAALRASVAPAHRHRCRAQS